jgi:pSer/pThr/pTyr-binding forkhead associated (FHA) protein
LGFRIQIIDGPESGKAYDFDRIEVTIGRTMDNDVILQDPSISRQHLSIRDKGGAYIVKDLGSSNGTKVNGKKILEEVLSTGDIILAGNVSILFEGVKSSVVSGVPKKTRERPARKLEKTDFVRHRLIPRKQVRGEGSVSEKRSKPNGAREQVLVQSKGIRKKENVPMASSDNDFSIKTEGKARAKATGVLQLWATAREKFLRLSKPKKLIMVCCAAMIVAMIIVSLVRSGRGVIQKVVDHSTEEFIPGEVDRYESPWSYGVGTVNTYCRTKAIFAFKYTTGRAIIIFHVAGVAGKQELDVLLNGVHVDYAPVVPPDNWSSEIRWTLPRKLLKQNETNRVTFVNAVNVTQAPKEKIWAVAVKAVEIQPLPNPDLKQAEESLRLARDHYKNKDVADGNVYLALKAFKLSRDYLELIPEESRPDIYVEADENIAKIEQEMEKGFKDMMFAAEKAKQYNKIENAKKIYKKIMNTFPDREDSRHQEAKANLLELE